MHHQFIDSGDLRKLLVGRDISPSEEREIVAQYIQMRLAQGIESDYADFETMLSNGIPADEVLKALKKDPPLA